jgi:hypothetical protein
MGRFDALTTLEEKQITKTPSPVVKSPTLNQPTNFTKIQQAEAKTIKKPTSTQVHKPTNSSPTADPTEKPEKYTTHLEPSMVKRIKRYALDEDMKDYQVIKEALLLFFEKNK